MAVLAVFPACPKPGPTPVGPTPSADAAPVADCGSACANESRLRCPAAVTCAAICPRLTRNEGRYVLCVTGAATCDDVNACNKPAANGGTHGPGGGRTGP